MNSKKIFPIFVFSFSLMLSACSHTVQTKQTQTTSADVNATINQQNVCAVSTDQIDESNKSCKIGQKIAFLPDSWGNEQLPIVFVASHCDMRYSVAMNNGGVVCIYLPTNNGNK